MVLKARPHATPIPEDPAVTLVYCKAIDTEKVTGFAIPETLFPDWKQAWNMVFVGNDRDPFLVAHEMGHVLTNAGHWRDDYELPLPPLGWPVFAEVTTNLMRLSGNLRDENLTMGPAKRLNLTE